MKAGSERKSDGARFLPNTYMEQALEPLYENTALISDNDK